MGNSNIEIDPAILRRARRNDRAAQQAIYTALAPLVFTIGRRMLASTPAAEDVLHETFIEVFTKLSTFRGDGELAAWVRRIAVNRCLMHLRSAWSVRRVDLSAAELLPAADDGIDMIDLQLLQDALDTLSPTSRTVVWLHDVEGYTHKEIGELMCRSTSFSKSQLSRAHAALRQYLAKCSDYDEAMICRSVSKR